jgi:hypothetical protein
MRDDFCVLILSHGRADRVVTIETLRRSGYTGKVFVVIDDEDATADEYRRRFGASVLQFSKEQIAATFDQGDNFKDRRSIVYARNASFAIVRSVGCRYFVQLDDDYQDLLYRRVGRREPGAEPSYHGWAIRGLDGLFEALVEFLEATPTATIAISQGGEHMGGAEGNTDIRLKRKAMNSFVCDVEKPFSFVGRMNEDVNTYVRLGGLGTLFFTYMPLQLNQFKTQSNAGGSTELYLAAGTYVKSFYTVMFAPSCVHIAPMGRTDVRLHHRVEWNKAVPKIVSPSLRKPRPEDEPRVEKIKPTVAAPDRRRKREEVCEK